MVSRALGLIVVLAALATAQELNPDPYAALATGAPVEVEAARRRLVTAPPDGLRLDVLEALLGHEDGQRRLAATSILLQHGRLADSDRAALRGDPELSVRQLLIESGDAAAARRAFETDTESVLRIAAWQRLGDLGAADDGDLVAALGDADGSVRRAAAAWLVCGVTPLPTACFRDLNADGRQALLEALAVRPRRAARAWARTLLDDTDLDIGEAVLVRLALQPEEWRRADAQVVLDGLASDDPMARGFALDAADLLPEELADGLIAEVHARVLSGGDADDLLRALDNVSLKGERHLAALARVLSADARASIVEWLMLRRSPVVDELVQDALTGRAPAEPFVLCQASPRLLADPEQAAAMAALLTDPAQPIAVRTAAFDALATAGRYTPELLAFALAPDADLNHCVRRILSLSPDALPDEAWGELLSVGDDRVVRMVLARMAEVARLDRHAERLRAMIDQEGPVALAAAEVCLRAGAPELVQSVWSAQSPARRQRLALALRDRREPPMLELLRAEPIVDGGFGLLEARLALGDRDALELVLRDPRAWPGHWLVRLRESAPPLLTADDLATVRELLFGESALASVPHRVELIGWVAARPDLEATELLRAARARGEPEEQDVALRGLLAIPAIGREIRTELAARFADGLDDHGKNIAYEAAGALVPPLDEEGAGFVARLALVEPLGHPLEELGVPLGRPAMQNLVWQQLGRQLTYGGVLAFWRAVDESLVHPHAYVASRRRLGELLALLARDPKTRQALGPRLADAVLATPDLDREHVGGALLIQAEAAERTGDWPGAAIAYRDACRALLSTPMDPLQLRSFVGEGYRATGEIWQARLTARAELCRARERHAAGDDQGARAAVARATELAEGDVATESAVAEFQKEIER